MTGAGGAVTCMMLFFTWGVETTQGFISTWDFSFWVTENFLTLSLRC